MVFLNFIFYFFSKFFWFIPRSCSVKLAWAMAYLWYDVIRFRRKLILENLKMAFPNENESILISIGRASIQNLCLSFLDYFILFLASKNNISKYVILENVETLETEYKKGNGVLVLSLHLGTIDLAPAALALYGFPLSITLKEINNKLINTFVDNLRKSKGVKPLADRRNPFEIFRAIKRGDVTVFVMDQYMGKPHGIELRFFDLPAGTATGLAGFSLKTSMPVVPVYNFRRADGKVYIVSDQPIYPKSVSEDFAENVAYNTQIYNDKIEQIVKKYPEQWMWVHRRWKKYS